MYVQVKQSPRVWIKTQVVLNRRVLFVRRRNDGFDVMLVQNKSKAFSVLAINQQVQVGRTAHRTGQVEVAFPMAVSDFSIVQILKQGDGGSQGLATDR